MKFITDVLDKISKHQKIVVFLFIPILTLLMHIKIFNKDLIGIHVWRQCQTQININNFYKHDFNIFNPTINDTRGGNGILRMEFPLMQWIFAIFYKLFGDHIIISRVLSFIIGLFTTFGFYLLINELFKQNKYSFLAAWIFTFSPLLYYYTLNPLPDNFALCFCVWSLFLFITFIRRDRFFLLLCSAFCLGISVLSKLPFIVYLSGYFAYCLLLFYQNNFRLTRKILQIALTYSLLILPAAIWYVKAIPSWTGNGIVSGILDNKSSFTDITDVLLGHLVSTLPELILNYGSVIFFVAGFYFIVKNKVYYSSIFITLLVISTAVAAYFFFEINMIGKAHDYYLFPFVPLIFIITYWGMINLLSSNNNLIKAIVVICLLILPFTAFLRTQSRWSDKSIGFNPDLKLYKIELRSAVPDTSLCVVGNDISHHISFYYINKKGWAFNDNQLSILELDEMIDKGAKYIYCDSRTIDENPEIQKRLKKKILEKGSFRIFELKKIDS